MHYSNTRKADDQSICPKCEERKKKLQEKVDS